MSLFGARQGRDMFLVDQRLQVIVSYSDIQRYAAGQLHASSHPNRVDRFTKSGIVAHARSQADDLCLTDTGSRV